MLAEIEKTNSGYTAVFKRMLDQSVAEVWAALTENGKLQNWFSNLQTVDLRKGGTIKFNMNDGSGESIDMKITDFQKDSVLEYEWGEGVVRFELSTHSNGTQLLLKDFFPVLNDHTAKDISGWHICLDVLVSLLNGVKIDFSMEEWNKVYEIYKAEMEQLMVSY
ncbi:SRPBCC family protein [Bacillus sp. FJAT-49736]|uniref:SRPBCC family protein n=1 Tax=Bacillus sp. FJAT-49736 TaxID=2833582 RepID=UPI001BC95C4E|nr:SRPBCC family protein [Bacillus sp. FJAT-49736]MBS4172763.1 SRPBCC family protein [Bacillus sp. FJAT-49736]